MKLQKPTLKQTLPIVFLTLFFIFKESTHYAFLESALLTSFVGSLDEIRGHKISLIQKLFLAQWAALIIGGLYLLKG